MGRVVNILIDNLEVFEEELTRDLIKNEISYVQIGNEFHFLNHIYRFYDLEKISKLLLQESLVITDDIFSKKNAECLKDIIDDIFSKKNAECLKDIIDDTSFSENNRYLQDINLVPKLNKNLIKRQNRIAKKIINKKS